MEITINVIWVVIAITIAFGAYFAGHFRGWVSANEDFYRSNQKENE